MSNQACQYSILGFNYRSNDSMNKSSPNGKNYSKFLNKKRNNISIDTFLIILNYFLIILFNKSYDPLFFLPHKNDYLINTLLSFLELCPKDAHFNASYPGNCQMYSNCNNGSYSTFECPNGYKFDGQAGRCTVMTQCDLLTCNAQGKK